MAFIMPAGLKLAELPKPASPAVTLRPVPGFKTAVLRFSGWSSEKTVRARTRQLEAALERDGLRPAAPVAAFYNPPFTPPFIRRNEVMIEIQ